MKTVSTLKDSRVAAAVMLLIVCLIGGCSKDCPTCPTEKPVEHYKGWLYYGEESAFYSCSIYKVDTETDSIVDSLRAPVGPSDPKTGAILQVSSDGRYLAVLWTTVDFVDSKLVIYDAQDLSVIKEIPERVAAHFDLENNLLLGVYAGQSGHFIHYYDVPSFNLIRVDSIGNIIPYEVDTKRYLVYGTAESGGWTHEYPDGFYSYNYQTKEMRRIPISLNAGDTVNVCRFKLNRDGTKMYFHGLASWLAIWAFVGCADLQTGQIEWWVPTVGYFGDVALSPDERELYVTDPGYPDYLNPGTVYIIDAQTGQHLKGISLYGYNPIPAAATGGTDIVFSPAGEKVYVCGADVGSGFGGSLLAVDTKTREITKIFRPDWKSYPHSPRIVPKK